jgi:hypothetical protein
MMRNWRHGLMTGLGKALAVVAMTGIGVAAPVVPAGAFSKAVQKACRADYKNLCPQYRVNSPQLRTCMESKSSEISWACIEALIDSGEVDKKRVRR